MPTAAAMKYFIFLILIATGMWVYMHQYCRGGRPRPPDHTNKRRKLCGMLSTPKNLEKTEVFCFCESVSGIKTEYVTELVQPDLSSKFDITVPQEDSTADIKNVIAENASATFANNTVKGSINIRLSKGQGAILIAQLYDTSTGLTKGTVVNPNLTASANINDITFNNISDKTNLTVKYYLWESFANMKALTTIQPIEVQ